MKLTIGENIRNFRKKNNLTQEELADRLGVTYQSVSRWENGATYPDLELLPIISELLSVTVNELLGMPQIEKEKRAVETFDELRRECMKRDYDAEKIVTLLRDIRRNYLDSDSAYRPWCEGNDRAFRDPKILSEVRLLAEAYLERRPMSSYVLRTMAWIEDEEHLEAFLNTHTTHSDCSKRALLFNRYLRHRDAERFEPERRYQLFKAIDSLLCQRYLLKWGESQERRFAADKFTEDFLEIIRCDAEDDRVDMWIVSRLEQTFNSAARSLAHGSPDEAIARLSSFASLLEETMKITDEVVLPTSCRFLDGMKWIAKEDWEDPNNDPDALEERNILVSTEMNGSILCHSIYPREFFDELQGKDFETLRSHPEFETLCRRVEALIVTREKNN